MSNTVESVKKLILDAVQKASGWMTIFGPTDGPEPANQYCLVTLRSQFKQPHEISSWTQTEDSLIEHQRAESTLKFEIQVRGKDAMTVADKITSYFDSELRDIDLWPYVGSGGHDDVQNVSTYHQGKILPVATFEIDIHTTLPKQNVVEYMTNVDITAHAVGDTLGPTTVQEVKDSQNS